ncbi:MAG TPA: hypothetical protein VJ579_03150 [Candidatus Paceibacterota bacterium]|nr:hypothetical protein [Candidatus Paceibacterota bacterium]
MKMLGVDLGSHNNEGLLPAICEEARRMVALLDDPQPGLFSWSRCMLSQLQQLQAYIAGALGTNQPVKFVETDAIYIPFTSGTPGQKLSTERVVNITGICPLRNWDVYLIYVKEERGGAVIVNDGGPMLMFWIEQLEAEMLVPAKNNTFSARALMLGLSPEGLRAIIEKYKP